MSEQQQSWGRVADDGTVFVRLPDGGEAQVGQWAAGDHAEGLAHYERRYADLVAEADLAAGRLRQGSSTPDQADEVVARIRAELSEPKVVGNIAGLLQLLDAIHAAASERRLTATAEAARRRAAAVARREAIVVEAEQLAQSTAWKATGDRFKELFEQWKAAPRIDRATDGRLWDRFKAARTSFDRRRKAHFAELDAARAAAAEAKEAIVAEAEALATSTEWGPTATAFRALMDRWKATARAGRDAEDQLWARFKKAQDTFFGARNADLADRDAGQEANLSAKRDLLKAAEALLPVRDVRSAKAALRGIQDSWEAIGFVPRNAKDEIESRLRRIERALQDAERDQWRRSDPAARARAEDTVAKFSASVAGVEADLEAAQAAGDAQRVEQLTETLQARRALLVAAQDALAEFSG